MRHSNFLFTIILFLICGGLFAQDFQEVPSLKSPVTDLTHTLTTSQTNNLASTLKAFANQKGSQVVVLLVPTTSPETIEQFGIRVAEQWKIGRKGVDDGVILLIAINDRKMRIEVGYGLEGAIPDAYAKRIIEQTIKPEFRSGDFYNGITKGTEAIMGLINGEDLPEYTQAQHKSVKASKYLSLLFPLALIILSVGNYFLKKKLGKKWGSIVFFVVVFIVMTFLVNFIVGLFASMITTALWSFPGRGGRGGGRRGGGGWFVGGGFGSGGSFGGGGGGFSGGGGSFGGGGASGGW